MEDNVYIISCVRTPLGSLNGGLSSIPGSKLCGFAIRESVKQSQINPSQFDSIYVGNVVTAGNGQNPAKQAALEGGLPETISCTLVNKVCCSSLKALTLAVQEIKCGDSQAAVAAGFESMSRCPHLLENSRTGYRMGDITAKDSLIKDGLWDAKYNQHMGQLVDALNEKLGITRQEQDRYAIQSFDRSKKAWEEKNFQDHIIPITVKSGVVERDENISKLKLEKVPLLKPSFTPNGTITPANASGIADGAAAVTICSKKFADENNIKPLARIISYADAGRDPAEFPLAPVDAAKKALQKAGLTKDDIDLWEVNEAFASVPIMFAREFGISEDILNILGGAVAVGHPLGCTGLRIVQALISALKIKGKKRGLATLCNGGGGGTAVIIELM